MPQQASYFGPPMPQQAPYFGIPTFQQSPYFGTPAPQQAAYYGTPVPQPSVYSTPVPQQPSYVATPMPQQPGFYGAPFTYASSPVPEFTKRERSPAQQDEQAVSKRAQKRQRRAENAVVDELRWIQQSIEGPSTRVWTAPPAKASSKVEAEMQAIQVKLESDLKEMKDRLAQKSAASFKVEPAAASTAIESADQNCEQGFTADVASSGQQHSSNPENNDPLPEVDVERGPSSDELSVMAILEDARLKATSQLRGTLVTFAERRQGYVHHIEALTNQTIKAWQYRIMSRLQHELNQPQMQPQLQALGQVLQRYRTSRLQALEVL